MDRKEYNIILSENNYIFKSDNSSFQYFIEIDDGFNDLGENNQDIKKINVLSSLAQELEFNSNGKSEEITIYVTSILNDINTFTTNNSTLHRMNQLMNNALYIVYSQGFEQILDLGSFENSLSFFYCAYDYESMTPKDFNPVNKAIFTKYDGELINLINTDNANDTIYIIYAEIYKLDYFINILDLFIGPKEPKKEILLEVDKLYLKTSDDYYSIHFKYSELNRIFKLSSKTNRSIIYDSNGNIILNGDNSYYELSENDVADGIKLKVTGEDCLIEILFSSENSDILGEQNYLENYKLTKPYTIVKVPKLRTRYTFTISSENKNNLELLHVAYNHKISKNSYFYNSFLISANINKKSFTISLDAPYLYNSDIKDDEYQILEIILTQDQLDNEIYLSYHPISFYSYLYLPMSEEECKYVRGNISSIIDKYYVYKDLAKKPPEIENLPNYHHPPIEMIKAIDSMNTTSQTYLSFYQQVDYVLNFVRDGHLNIQLRNILNRIDLSKTILALPFKFYIITNENDEPIMKITGYQDIIDIIPNQELFVQYLKAHLDIPIKSINKTDPFEFIQNLGKFQKFRNRHAQFTYNLVVSSRLGIPAFPLDYADLINIEIEFENGDTFSYDYVAANLARFSDINNKEFEEFHTNLVNNQMNHFLIPDLLETRRMYLKKKGLLLEDETSAVNWDISTSDGRLKCRVDEENKYNVFLQTSFSYDDFDEAVYVMTKCSELFYSNNYKIIGIENLNGGGYAVLYEVWHQLIQQKTLDKTYRAVLRNKDIFDYFTKYGYYASYANIKTCKYSSSMEELGEIEDNYGYSDIFGYEIKHNRTGIYEFLERTQRKRLERMREYNLKENTANLKRSTDILIYTDGYSFSSTSGFLKAFQNTGGAIIVGYNGNPKIEGTKEFDASQSSSSVTAFQVEENYNLQNYGYKVNGITYSESYDDSYKRTDETPIPREYTVDLIDERVPIYSNYYDSLYDEFISQADKIFKNYETSCSLNDPRLLLEDEKCDLNEHEHGGHPCGSDGKWDMNKCEAYYCDLGYYFDTYLKECVLDICTNGKETEIYLNDSYIETHEYKVKPDEELVFHLTDPNYYYFFSGSVNNIFNYFYNSDMEEENNFLMAQYIQYGYNLYEPELSVNYHLNIKEEATVKVTAVPVNPKTYIEYCAYTTGAAFYGYDVMNDDYTFIYGIQSPNQHFVYSSSYNKGVNAFFTSYTSDMAPKDIIDMNTEIYDITLNKLILTEQNLPAIIAYQTSPNISSLYLVIMPKDIGQSISISKQRFLYLSNKDEDYNLYFSSDKNFYLKLVNETLDAELEILDGSNEILNKGNRYIFFDKSKTIVSLRLKTDNPALIEIAHEYTIKDENKLNISETDFDLEGGLYTLKCKKSNNISSINLYLDSNIEITGFIFSNIGKGNFLPDLPDSRSTQSDIIESHFIVPNDYMDDDEEFIIYINIKNKAHLLLDIEYEKESESDIPDTSDIPPDTSDIPPDTSDIPPDTSDIVPDTSDIVPDTSDISPDTSDIPPDTSDISPDTSDIPPDTSDISPDSSDIPIPPDTSDIPIPPDTSDIPIPPDSSDIPIPSDNPTDSTDHPTDSTDTPTDTSSDTSNDTGDNNSNDDFPVWAIVLISIVGVIIIALIIFFIIRIVTKNKVDNFDAEAGGTLLKDTSELQDK